jgi:hypothetical protein
VFSCVLAGGGISGGQVYGSSDREGGYPASDPVDAGHLAATVFHLVGINTQGTFTDRLGRELSISESEPLYTLLGEEPATAARTQTSGEIAFVPPYRPGLLLHSDFEETTGLPSLEAPASPKGWRGSPLVGVGVGFGVRLLESSNAKKTAAIGIWTQRANSSLKLPASMNGVLAQQIRDPQSGHFTARATVAGGGSSPEFFQSLFLTNFRCRLVIFQFSHPSKSAANRQELASVEFVPTFQSNVDQDSWPVIKLEKRLAPTPGANFSFGLGIGVAVIVERKTEGILELPVQSGDAFLQIVRVEIGFEGWKIG